MVIAKDVDTYITSSDEKGHSIMNEIREIIKLTIEGVEEGISYGVPFYKYYGNFVGFAAYKEHISFGYGADILDSKSREMLEEKGYVLGKGTMQIKFDQKVPVEEIKQILKLKAKMNENESAEK